jgi:hypothetical protein
MGTMNSQSIKQDGSFGLDAPKYVDSRVLAANTAETVTIPYNAASVFFSANNDFFVCWDGGTAAVPAADVTDGTGSELNPTVRTFPVKVSPASQSTFSIISASTCIVTMAFFRS